MPPASQFGFHLAEFAPQTFPRRQPQQSELSLPGLPTDVCEALEVKGLWLAPSAPLPVCGREAAKFQKAGLIGVQLQPELRESLR
jgi:hypothetical protein